MKIKILRNKQSENGIKPANYQKISERIIELKKIQRNKTKPTVVIGSTANSTTANNQSPNLITQLSNSGISANV